MMSLSSRGSSSNAPAPATLTCTGERPTSCPEGSPTLPALLLGIITIFAVSMGPMLGNPAVARGQESGTRPMAATGEPRLQAGMVEAGLAAGYGKAVEIFGTTDERPQLALIVPRIGYFLTNTRGPVPLRGNLEIVGEPLFALTTEPTSTLAKGASALVRYHFWTGTRLLPVAEAGAGIIDINRAVSRDLGRDLNFSLHLGGGVLYFVRERWALWLQYRHLHVSNAGTAAPNSGMNSNLVIFGLSTYWGRERSTPQTRQTR